MKCRHAKKLIFDYIDGAISEADRIGLEQHLTDCRACEASAASLTKSLDLLHRLPVASPSENFNWKLRLKLAKDRSTWRDALESERALYRIWNTRFAVGVVSGFLAVIVGGFALLSQNEGRVGVDYARFGETPRGQIPAARSQSGEAPTWTYEPFTLPTAGGIGSRPVSTGGSPVVEPGARRSGPLVNSDSLGVRVLESMLERQRIRQLEQQIEILHDELEKCNRGRQ